jgi:micrococcal nuclease
MYEYRCKLRKVVDGDTIDVDIDLGFGVWLKDERVRLSGIDTPESRTSDKVEKKYGLAAKHYVERFTDDEWLILKTKEYDAKGKFGRILGEIWRTSSFADQSLNDYLIEKHHAVYYYGQAKHMVEAEHLKNRELVKLDE